MAEVFIAVLQVVGSVFGPVLLLLVKKKIEVEEDSSSAGTTTESPTIATQWLSRGRDRALLAERQLVLAAGLIATSICCTVALGVIRTNATIDTQMAFLIGLFVCVSMPALSIWAWRQDALPLILGYWCLLSATLQVALAVTAPRGEYALPLFSVAVILLISIAAVAYFVGSPRRRGESLAKLSPSLRRVVRITSWPLVVGLCSALVLLEANSMINWMADAPYVTRLRLQEVREKADQIFALEGEPLQTFYRVASELALLPSYQQAFEKDFDGSALDDASVLVVDNVVVPENRKEYSIEGVLSELPEDYSFGWFLPLGRDQFDSDASFRSYKMSEAAWRKGLARQQDFYGPWNWFSGEEFTRHDQHRQRRLLELRAEIVHPLSPVASRRRIGVNTFSANDRLHEFSQVRAGWASGFEPGFQPENSREGLAVGLAEILMARKDSAVEFWVFPHDSSDGLPAPERARQVIATYPRLSDSILENVLASQLQGRFAEDEVVAYWQYLQLALATSDEVRLQVARRFLDLSPSNKTLVRRLFIRPGPAGASPQDGIYDSLVWFLGELAATAETDPSVDQIRNGLVPESFKLTLEGRKSKLLDNEVLEKVRQAAQDDKRKPVVEGLPGDVLIGLISQQVMSFCQAVSEVEWDDDGDYRSLLAVLDDPITSAWRRILGSDVDRSLITAVDVFSGLKQPQKEAVLTELALDKLYSAPTEAARIPYHFGRAYSDSPVLGWTVASGIGFLVVLGFLWLGLRLSRVFSFRERVLDLAQLAIRDADERTAWGGSAPTTPVELTGRGESLRWLSHITRRGYGTVGIVGRRGVGKTRILRSLLETSWPDVDDDESQSNGGYHWSLDSVGVWLSVPTGFSEREFIQDLHFSLARSVEERLAWKLRVLPYRARLLLASLRNLQLVVLGVLGILFVLVWSEIGLNATTGTAAAFWWSWFVIAGSALLAAVSLSSLPPVNLYSWLIRGHSNSRSGVIAASLYQVSLKYIQVASKTTVPPRLINSVVWTLLSFGAVWLFVAGMWLLVIGDGGLTETLTIGGLMAGALILAAAARARERGMRQNPEPRDPQPLAAAIRSYRDFAQEVVSALGHLGGGQAGRVIICLDELDKVISPQEIREFLRRMKALFEIKGVFYFVSLAEDARQKLVLGTSYGKDEVDSSFDHIRRLKPLDASETTALLDAYWREVTKRDDAMLDDRIKAYGLAFSGGVARDVFRALDVWANENELANSPPDTETAASFLVERIDEEWSELQELIGKLADRDQLLAEIAAMSDEQGEKLDPETLFPTIGDFLSRVKNEWMKDVEHLAERELGVRGLLRIFLLLFVVVDWDPRLARFQALGSAAARHELCSLSFLIPVGRVGRLIDRTMELTRFHRPGLRLQTNRSK